MALALNALVLPGLGHIVMGFKKTGLLLITFSIIFIVAPIYVYTSSMLVSLRASMPYTPSMNSSLKVVSQAYYSNNLFINLCMFGLLIVWAFGIFDILRKKK